jgi:hypothetical protein
MLDMLSFDPVADAAALVALLLAWRQNQKKGSYTYVDTNVHTVGQQKGAP